MYNSHFWCEIAPFSSFQKRVSNGESQQLPKHQYVVSLARDFNDFGDGTVRQQRRVYGDYKFRDTFLRLRKNNSREVIGTAFVVTFLIHLFCLKGCCFDDFLSRRFGNRYGFCLFNNRRERNIIKFSNSTPIGKEVADVCASDFIFTERLDERSFSRIAAVFRIDGNQSLMRYESISLAVCDVVSRILFSILLMPITSQPYAVFLWEKSIS